MPPLVFLAVLGAAGIAGYKFLSSFIQQHDARKDPRHMSRATAPARDLGSLEWDEASGVYRPSTKRREG